MPQADHDAGFTLIEILVVLAVLALVAGMVILRGPSGSGAIDMRAATSLVAGGLRQARGQAIARDRPVPVRFAADGSAFQVGAAAVQRLPRGIRKVAGAAIILFRPDGSSSGGRVELAGGAQAGAVDVAWLTGRVTKTP